ncbi:hypothetical protein OK074_1674 [Actinobacteria bacterium OK074]|nr:hypothetical protein OK074_1674 [Actinobacteria bacterium OK074]
MDAWRVFEHLCVQLFPDMLAEDRFRNAYGEFAQNSVRALRPPDGGIECYARLLDGRMVGMQAKRHSTLSAAFVSVKKSVRSVLMHHPDLIVLIVCVHQDPTASEVQAWDKAEAEWQAVVEEHRPGRPMEFHRCSRENIESLLMGNAPVASAFLDPPLAPLVDVHRHSHAVAVGVRQRHGPLDAATPLLRTPLADALAELDQPRPAVQRIREAVRAISRWEGWEPRTDGLAPATTEALTAAWVRWSAQREARCHCTEAWDRAAGLLESDGVGAVPQQRSALRAALAATRTVVDAVDHLRQDALDALNLAGAPETLSLDERRALQRTAVVVQDFLASCGLLTGLGDEPALSAHAYGALLVSGGWGTGKSYGLAGWVTSRIAAGAPTALACGHEFDGHRSWESQLPGLCAPGGRDSSLRSFLAVLQAHAQITGRHAVLAVDALNEIPGLAGTEFEALTSLASLVREYPLVVLVATTRLNHARDLPDSETARYAAYWTRGVEDPMAAWRVFQDVYGLPPLALPPDAGELRRPLMLAVLARCLYKSASSGELRDPVPVPTVGELFAQWLDVLNREYCGSLWPGGRTEPQPLVTRACHALALRMGREDRLEHAVACQVLDNEPGLRDSASLIEWLRRAGVLAVDREGGQVRFAVQRLAEHFWALNLLNRPFPSRAITRLVVAADREKGMGDATRRVYALASAAPQARRHNELTRYLRVRRSPTAALAVLDSLEGRSKDASGHATGFLRRQVTDRRIAPWTWYTVFVNSASPAHPAGARFLHKRLRRWGRARREQCFVTAVLTLMQDEDGLLLLRRFLHWCHTSGAGRRDLAEGLSYVLLWLAAVPSQPLRSQCVRTLASLWRDDPSIPGGLAGYFAAHPDALVAEAFWLAMHGTLSRMPQRPVPEPWKAALRRADGRAHLGVQAAADSVRELLGIPRDTAGGQRPRRPRTLPMPRRWNLRRASWVEGIAGAWTPYPEDDPSQRLMWVARRSRTLDLLHRPPWRTRGRAKGRSDFLRLKALEAKSVETALMEWYAMAAGVEPPSHARGAAGIGTEGAEQEAIPDGRPHPYRGYGIDPTLPPEWPSTVDTTCRPDSWWCVLPPRPAPSAPLGPGDIDAGRALTVRDTDGEEWCVIRTQYHLPCHEPAEGDDARLPILEAAPHTTSLADLWRWDSPAEREDNTPEVFVDVRAFLVPAGQKENAALRLASEGWLRDLTEQWPAHLCFADYYRITDIRRSNTGENAVPHPCLPMNLTYEHTLRSLSLGSLMEGPAERAVPTKALADLLGLRWSGQCLAFVREDDSAPVVMDPALRCAGPPALLLRTSTAKELAARGLRVLWEVNVSATRNPYPPRSRYFALDALSGTGTRPIEVTLPHFDGDAGDAVEPPKPPGHR